ncbi:MAG: thioredoxin [Chloroflexi bacterium]|nr:thioredoxin [Chloroflexota bacterium]
MSFIKSLLNNNPTPQPTNNDDPNRPQPIRITDAEFAEKILQSDKLALVDLWADWCRPCHMIAPTIEKLAAEYDGRVVVAKLNVDENPATPGRYGIMGIPTVLFFKNGEEVDRIVGVQNYPAFVNRIERWLGA